MSPDAETALDRVMDLLNRKLEPLDWVDIGQAIMVLGLARLSEEHRQRLCSLLGISIERGLTMLDESRPDRQERTQTGTLH